MDTSGLKFPKGQPGVLTKHARLIQQERQLLKAYAEVNERDGNRCRVTGVRLYAVSSNDKTRREHHHLQGRCVRPEWLTRPRRIVLVSAFVHRLLTAYAIIPNQLDANKPIQWHWNYRVVRPGEEPLRLRNVATLHRKDGK
jgi:hypothetical protein